MRSREMIDTLEARRMLATFTVINTNDTGVGSMRQAITDAAASVANDVIAFNLSTGGTGGVYTIRPVTLLPEIGDNDWVDGTTQPGYVDKPRVEIDGSIVPTRGSGSAYEDFNSSGISIKSGGGVKGLSLVKWPYAGILVSSPYVNVGANPVVEGNFVGLRADGVTAAGNGRGIVSWRPVQIGGPLPSQRNVVSSNTLAGITVTTDTGNTVIDGTVIENNVVGLSADLSLPRGNGEIGIDVVRFTGVDVPGGAVRVTKNSVAHNSGIGIRSFEWSRRAGVRLEQNSIYSNGGLGIDTAAQGVNVDDIPDTDFAINRPVVTGTTTLPDGANRITGYVQTVPDAPIIIDFYRSAAIDPSGYGEGQTYVTSATVTTDANGYANFSVDVSAVANMSLVSATATGPTGQTSEFSNSTVPAIQVGNITGYFFDDRNLNGVFDAPDWQYGNLSSQVYVDLNRDGIRQIGEPVSSVFKNSFFFDSLRVGQHELRFILVPNVIVTNPTVSNSISITVVANTTVVQNIGVARPEVTISGRIYHDYAGDGIGSGNTTDDRIFGWPATVWADVNNNGQRDVGERSTTTSQHGRYTLVVPPGTHVIRAESSGYRATGVTSRTVNLPNNRDVALNVDFGLDDFSSDVSFKSFFDVNGNGTRDAGEVYSFGLQIYLDVDRNGRYDPLVDSLRNYAGWFPDYALTAGTFQFAAPAFDDGWSTLVTTPQALNVTLGQNDYKMIEVGYQRFGRVSVVVNSVSDGLPVYIDLNNNGALDTGEPSQLGVANTPILFDRLPLGTFAVLQILPTGLWRNTNAFVNVREGQATQVQLNPFYEPAAISGVAFVDTNNNAIQDIGEPVIANQRVYLDSQPYNGKYDNFDRQSFTNNNGVYTFANLSAGAYRVGVDNPSGYSSLFRDVTLIGTNVPNTNFAVKPPVVTTPITLQAEAFDTILHAGPANTHAGFTGTGYIDYFGAGLSSDITLKAYRHFAGSARLELRYANGAMINRPLQVFVNNVSVGTVACTPTGAWNKWAVGSLNNVNLPSGGFTIRIASVGFDGGANLDAVSIVALTPPSVTGSISGTVFSDTNKNGLFNTGEARLANRVVFIDLDNDNILDSNERRMLTDASGNFRFDGLTAGTYKIRRVLPTGFRVTTPVADVTLTPGQIFSNVLIGAAN